jgi:hypothetical protein
VVYALALSIRLNVRVRIRVCDPPVLFLTTLPATPPTHLPTHPSIPPTHHLTRHYLPPIPTGLWACDKPQYINTNATAMKNVSFVVGMVKGGSTQWGIKAGDAQRGPLVKTYEVRPLYI